MAAASSKGPSSLKEYLKRYEINNEEDNKKIKKKKKKVKPNPQGVLVLDEDPVWQKPVKVEEEEENDSADEEKPVVDEDIEVKRMRRLEQLRARRPFNAIAEDGSGWVSLSPTHESSVVPNADFSPPRKRRTRNDTPSPEHQRKHLYSGREDNDLSPPRQRQKHHHSPSPEPDRKPAHNSDAQTFVRDMSLSHRRWTRNDTPSPSAEGKHLDAGKEDTDLSPPRQRRRRRHTPSPEPERKFPDSGREDTDLSPPRQQRRRYHTPSPEPDGKSAHPRVSRIQKSDHGRWKSEMPDFSDISPPRQSRDNSQYRLSLGTDLSPPRKSRKDGGRSESRDLSPRWLHRHSIDNDNAPTSQGQDISPPRKSRKESSNPVPSKTGLITGRDMREEIHRTKKDDALRFEQMDPSISGRGAEPVFRNKKGERISKDEYLKSKQKVEEKPKEIKIEWGKGLAQKREAEARLLELEHEKDKPFARTRDDPELDKMLKDRVRWGDPMAHLVKKKHSEPVLTDLGDNEKMKDSGFIIPQEIPSHSWIKRGLEAAPNRYGIKPGRHWDGVDRSNGYEKQLFKRMNEKRATEREAYLWSVTDM